MDALQGVNGLLQSLRLRMQGAGRPAAGGTGRWDGGDHADCSTSSAAARLLRRSTLDHSSSTNSACRPSRVAFPPPFAAISNPFGGFGGGGGGDKGGKASAAAAASASKPSLLKSPGQMQKQAEQQQQQPQQQQQQEERILISEVVVAGVDGELERVARAALTTRPGYGYTLSEVEADLRRVFATGWFSSCKPDAEDTRDGVRLVVNVTPNPTLRGVVARGADVLPARVLRRAFAPLAGRPLNFVSFGAAVEAVDAWYQRRGALGQVVDFALDGDGVAELVVGEARVASIALRFVDAASGGAREAGATRPEVVTRHLTTSPGRVYSLRQAKADIDAIYSTGLFEDVTILPKEAEGSSEASPSIDLTLNLVERKTGGLGAGTGISAQANREGALPGFVGNLSYSQRNLRGLGQRLTALAELGQADSLFRLQLSDPWVLGDPHRTSRALSLMNNRTSGAAIHGRAEEPDAAGADDAADAGGAGAPPAAANSGAGAVVLGRVLGSVELRRPLHPNWSGAAALNWQRSRCMDERGAPLASDAYGAPLTFSGRDADTELVGLLSAAYSDPRDGSQLSVSVEQALPLAGDWLRFSRIRARAEQPIRLPAALGLGGAALHVRGRAGAVVGDLPPYDAFALGGVNSVRGYSEGGVGSARRFVEAGAELRWRAAGPLAATLFADYGADLDSGESVLGDPAGARGKPGSGYGYGAGVRVDSPLGPVRLEYAWNAARRGRFHVAVGYD